MTYQNLFETGPGQDGAVFNDFMFRFDQDGSCKVFSMIDYSFLSEFKVEKTEVLMPHSNAVCFGSEYYDADDEFPLLYTNIYNTYDDLEDRMEGVVCVYRLTRTDKQFNAKLVQVIRIGFVDDLTLWKSLDNNGDVRPYGNFVVDTDLRQLCAFTMRDKDLATRYFVLNLPELSDGVYDENYGVNVVVLTKNDIISFFDCEYSRYLQGACYHDGKIYSVEGFSKNSVNKPKLQIIDIDAQKQIYSCEICDYGLESEPEFIEVYNGDIIYSDCNGNVCKLQLKM